MSLAVGGSCNIQVTFTPTAATTYSALLTLTDSIQSLSSSLTLAGTGVVNQLAVPGVSPAGGTYNNNQTVTFTLTPGTATGCVRFDGGQPTANTPGVCDSAGDEFTYTVPIAVTASTTFTYIATKATYANSAIGSTQYVFQVATPSIGQVGNVYTFTSATTGTTHCVTLNSIPPITNGAGGCLYGAAVSNGGTITANGSPKVQVIGTLAGYTDSGVVSTGTATPPTPSKPVMM
jgi:hypothetical protein